MPTIDDVLTQVASLTDVDSGLSQVIDQIIAQDTDLKARLDAAIASQDPAKLQAVSDGLAQSIADLSAKKQAIIDAITANTPA